MYCYTVFVGEPQKGKDNSEDLAILKLQKSKSLGVFGCNAFSVFSDVIVDYGGATTTKVVPTRDWKSIAVTGRWLRTPLFMGVWKHILVSGAWQRFSWTVKVDIPTVFLPGLLLSKLSSYLVPESGTYIETCNNVKMGYFGNLGIASRTGMSRFLRQFESYYINGGKCWKWDTPECRKVWQYGPWGEDLFMQFAMDDAGVMKKSEFQLINTGTCPGKGKGKGKKPPKADKNNKEFVPSCANGGKDKFVAVHPLRDVKAWEKCYNTFSGAP